MTLNNFGGFFVRYMQTRVSIQPEINPNALGFYITKPQLAERLQVSLRSIDNYLKKKKIPVIRLGKSVRFRFSDVEKALERYTVREVR